MMSEALVLLDAYALEIALAALVLVPILALAVRSRLSKRARSTVAPLTPPAPPAPPPQTAARAGADAIGLPPGPGVVGRDAAPLDERPVVATVPSPAESAPEPVAEPVASPLNDPVIRPVAGAASEPLPATGEREPALGVHPVVPDDECAPAPPPDAGAGPAVELIELASAPSGMPVAADTAPAAEATAVPEVPEVADVPEMATVATVAAQASGVPVAEPAEPVAGPSPIDAAAPVVAAAPVPAEAPPTVDAAPARLLVVDDSAVVRAKLRKLLEGAGYQVEVARDGREALAMLTSGRYALLVTDLEMPTMSGFELIAAVRAMAEVGPVPIVAISGHDDLEAYRARLPGVSGLFRKPWSDAELLAQLGGVVARPRAPAPAATAEALRPPVPAEPTHCP